MQEAVQEVLGERERLLGRIFPAIGSSFLPGPPLDHTWVVGGCFPFESRGWGLLPLGLLSLPVVHLSKPLFSQPCEEKRVGVAHSQQWSQEPVGAT